MSYVHHTILVVDDNPDDAHFTKLALQRVGVISPVQTVSDGEEALSYLSGQGNYADPRSCPRPVLVLLDLKLPRKSGMELLAWLRQQPVLKRLPVIVLTSSRELDDVNRAYELGCNSYLVKPTSFNTLLVMMQGLVQYWLNLNETPVVCIGTERPLHGEPAPDGAWTRVT
jgi:CheY-like chemotaxis protein